MSEAAAAPVASLVFLPAAGAGHLASTLEMAKRLDARFSIYVFTMRPHLPEMAAPGASSYTQSVAFSGITISELPPVDYSVDPGNRDGLSIMSNFIHAHRPHVKEAITSLLASPSALPIAGIVIDMFSSSMIDLGKELRLPVYVYFTSGAAMMGFMLYLPTLDVEFPSGIANAEGDIHVPSFAAPVPPKVMPQPFLDKKLDGYAWFVRHGLKYREAEGILVNSFADLEPTAAQALAEGRCIPDHATPPVYLVGPVLSPGSAPPDHDCLKWLDGQPQASVVFLCFGSMGSFGKEQITEIALGLEQSEHRFLWSLRTRKSDKSFVLPLPGEADLGATLPDGFLERTKDRGLVWPKWAPQAEVLAHPAVGGFVTHCGWNSTLETVWNGLPTLAWPLYAEQKMNALQMVTETGLAVDVFWGGQVDIVTAEEVERGVRSLMGESEKGRSARARAAEMKRRSRAASAEGGSSAQAMDRLVERLMGGVNAL